MRFGNGRADVARDEHNGRAARRKAMIGSVVALAGVAGTPAASAQAATIPVACTAAALVSAVQTANGTAASDTLTLASGCTYTLTSAASTSYGFTGLPAITNPLVVTGNGATIERGGAAPSFRLITVASGASLSLSNLDLTGGLAQGGAGGSASGDPDEGGGGGGGAGLGGAIYNRGSLQLSGVVIAGNEARGGAGGDGADASTSISDAGGGGGGGGLGGAGGSTSDAGDDGDGGAGGGGFGGAGGAVLADARGGGGGGGTTGPGGAAVNPSGVDPGGAGGVVNGGKGGDEVVVATAGTGNPEDGANGGDGGGGGGGGDEGNGGNGGVGGGGGGTGESDSNINPLVGGSGGFGGGGGGGGEDASGGAGGFGGGGGGANDGDADGSAIAGQGGFGAGDGGAPPPVDSTSSGGGGGAGVGGAVFNDAGTLTLNCTVIDANTVAGGAGGAGDVAGEAGTGVEIGVYNHNGATSNDLGCDLYESVVEGDVPAGYWRFGEPSGTTMLDSSGTVPPNNGTYIGGVTLNQPGALVGSSNTAALYDGIDDQGRVPDANSLDVGNSFTAEGWIKRSSEAKTHELMNKGANGIHLVVSNAASLNKVLLRRAGVATIADSTVGVPADGRYHHVVATMNGLGSTAKIYIDGQDRTHVVAPGQTILNTAFPLTFGSFGSAPATPAFYDEFALYDSALTAAQVSAHYNEGVD
jgi:hypothetical protein